jgi:hypothetical protein
LACVLNPDYADEIEKLVEDPEGPGGPLRGDTMARCWIERILLECSMGNDEQFVDVWSHATNLQRFTYEGDLENSPRLKQALEEMEERGEPPESK